MADAYIPGGFERTVFSQAPLCVNPQSSSGNAYIGTTLISSSAVQLIPAGGVNSGCIVLFSLERLVVGSEAVPQYMVSSIVPGTGFYLDTQASWSLLNSYYVNWFVLNQR